jgi:uncharacterized membrane protein YbaN (DUF454 family)
MRDARTPPPITVTLGRALCRTVIQQLQELSHRLQQVEGVQSVMTRLDSCNGQQVIIYPQEGVAAADLLRRMAVALRAPVATARVTTISLPPESICGVLQPDARPGCSVIVEGATSPGNVRQGSIVQRLIEIGYGTLAVASLGMAWIGLLVPGIPTVPFVILTVALAAKASPALRHRLRQARVFGPMIRDWEQHHAIRPGVRRQAIIVTVVLISITLLAAPPSVGLYLLVATMSVVSITLVLRIPVITEQESIEPGGSAPRIRGFSAVA